MAQEGSRNSLARLAKTAGMSKEAFAEGNIHADGNVGKLARIYFYSQGVHGDGKANMGSPGDNKPNRPSDILYQVG